MAELRAVQYVVLKPLLVDLGGEGLETLPIGHVLEQHDVVSWGRSVDALVEAGKLGRVPKTIEAPTQFTDEQLLTELESRRLHTVTPEPQPAEVPDGARVFTAADAPEIVENGVAAVKRPNPVHLLQQSEPFAVETDSGTMVGEPGGFVAHDPVSGHVWPISLDYANAHYDPVAAEGTAEETDESATSSGSSTTDEGEKTEDPVEVVEAPKRTRAPRATAAKPAAARTPKTAAAKPRATKTRPKKA